MEIETVFKKQQLFFNSNKTKDIAFRINQLKKLKTLLISNEQFLNEAIHKDFGKSAFDTYMTELSVVYHELNLMIKNLKKWSNTKRVGTNLANFPAKSYIIPEPLGTTLVIGAWNYPYQLSLAPALAALAAGNTVVIKPSELPLNTSKIMAKLINENFPKEYFHVIEGGVQETTELLNHAWDKIFFTGSIAVGKIVYQAAAKHLTPVTLELGGKSPAFVFNGCNIAITAQRLVWSKFLNAGQTCVAPDYVFVEKSIEQEFLQALKQEIDNIYPQLEDIQENFPRIINTANFNRLEALIDKDKLYMGGHCNAEKCFIQPTILKDIDFEDPIMKDEIFGPILPVLSFDDIDSAIALVKKQSKPLSAYVYSGNKKTIKKILHEISFGGGGVNESIMHLSNSNLPFGGVGYSGMGSYHGKAGFDTFTHYKSIIDKSTFMEAKVKYAPYSGLKLKLIRWMMD